MVLRTRLIATLGLALSLGVPAISAPMSRAAEVEARVSANIVAKAGVSMEQELTILDVLPEPGGTALVVTVPSDGTLLCDKGRDCGGTIHAAEFFVGGAAHQSYAITLPGAKEVETGEGSLVLDNFTDSQGGIGTLDASGRARFGVGVRAVLTPNQATGTYRGTFPVSVNYN